MPFSDSPTHFESSSGPLIEIKLASHWLAIARAINVLPDPGGPDSSTPRGGSTLAWLYISGKRKGHSTPSVNNVFTFSRPPMSSQDVSLTSTYTSRVVDGSTSRNAT